MNAHDVTVQGPMTMSLGIAMVMGPKADPAEREAFIEDLMILGQKATPQTQDYLTRLMHSTICRDALRILRAKGIV